MFQFGGSRFIVLGSWLDNRLVLNDEPHLEQRTRNSERRTSNIEHRTQNGTIQ